MGSPENSAAAEAFEADVDCTVQEVTVSDVHAYSYFVRVTTDEGGVIHLHPDHMVQFGLNGNLKPGAVLQVSRSLWPNGGIVDIRAVS